MAKNKLFSFLGLVLVSCMAACAPATPVESKQGEESKVDESVSDSQEESKEESVAPSSSSSQAEEAPTIIEKLPVPSKLTTTNEHAGKIEVFNYTTKVYDIDGNGTTTVEKKADVYLPYGYDATKQYNVLYLMHGGGETYTYWLTQQKQTARLLDNLFDKGYVAPCIVVAPTFYTGDSNNSMSEVATDVFQYEFRNDLVPNLEKAYATYSKNDTSVEGLRKTRDHRGFAGLSMGSMVSIRSILLGCLDICAYINSMSGGYAANTTDTQKAFNLIKDAVTVKFKDYPVKFWFNHNGNNDMALTPHEQLKNMILSDLGDVFKENVNFRWIKFPTGQHSYPSWLAGLYNCLFVFFTK